jgi:hypothetical protein
MNTKNLICGLKPEQSTDQKEEVATWPSEPYKLDWDAINWN